jgi:hypothetical protein
MVHLSEIPETGVYKPRHDGKKRESEELLEIRRGKYVDRIYWDRDELADGSPLPDGSRPIVRWLEGKVMFVCKQSIWNRIEGGDYSHNKMSTEEIRDEIAKRIEHKPAKGAVQL